MSEEVSSKPPVSFYVISGIALIWNLIGVFNYVTQVTMTEEALAALDPAQRAYMEATPSWLIAVYALGVNTGALGCLLLLLRKAWSVPILIVSLVCVVVQMGYSTFLTNAMEVYGSSIAALGAVIVLIAIFLVWYSRGAQAKGWLS